MFNAVASAFYKSLTGKRQNQRAEHELHGLPPATNSRKRTLDNSSSESEKYAPGESASKRSRTLSEISCSDDSSLTEQFHIFFDKSWRFTRNYFTRPFTPIVRSSMQQATSRLNDLNHSNGIAEHQEEDFEMWSKYNKMGPVKKNGPASLRDKHLPRKGDKGKPKSDGENPHMVSQNDGGGGAFGHHEKFRHSRESSKKRSMYSLGSNEHGATTKSKFMNGAETKKTSMWQKVKPRIACNQRRAHGAASTIKREEEALYRKMIGSQIQGMPPLPQPRSKKPVTTPAAADLMYKYDKRIATVKKGLVYPCATKETLSSSVNLFQKPSLRDQCRNYIGHGHTSKREPETICLEDDECISTASLPSKESYSRFEFARAAIRPSNFAKQEKMPEEVTLKSQFLQDDYMKEREGRHLHAIGEFDRQAEEEGAKVLELRVQRKNLDKDLNARIRDQLRLCQRDPQVFEEVFADEDEEEEEGMPPLTEEMEQIVDNALVPVPSDEVLSKSASGFSVNRHDMQTLDGLNWLNDEVINFYMDLIVERGKQESFPSVHVFNTFFYGKIMSGGHGAVRRWTKRVDIFNFDVLLIPVHLGVHWCLATVDVPQKTIKYYDSMGSDNTPALKAIRQYLKDEHLAKKNSALDMSDWNMQNVKNIPLQKNGSDCGMFCCKFGEYASRRKEINFAQEDMAYFRRRTVHEILTKRLM